MPVDWMPSTTYPPSIAPEVKDDPVRSDSAYAPGAESNTRHREGLGCEPDAYNDLARKAMPKGKGPVVTGTSSGSGVLSPEKVDPCNSIPPPDCW